YFFFFQAEDGIRYFHVTGVQTCALPICRDITEFWRRWHISLSSWLRDYLYIPLGGNRKSTFSTYLFCLLFFVAVFFGSKHLLGLNNQYAGILCASISIVLLIPGLIKWKMSGVAANMNLLTTMLLGGFWH